MMTRHVGYERADRTSGVASVFIPDVPEMGDAEEIYWWGFFQALELYRCNPGLSLVERLEA